MTLFVIVSGLIGLIFGSFANVCVHRIPLRQSVAFPASHCPHCDHAIDWFDNIPLFSWLWLRGRCRHCSHPIAWRYPLLELLMGVSWAFLAWHFGPTLQCLEALVLFFLLWVLTVIDLETGLLPNALTFPGMALGLVFSWLLGGQEGLIDGVIGAIAGYGIFWGVARIFLLLTGREGMGYGDFKLLAMLGAFMGWQALPFVIFASSLVGAVIGSLFLLLSRRGLRAEIPFGPYLALAGMAWFIWGQELLAWYSGLLGLGR